MLHGFPGKDTVVGAEVTVGHGAVLHGCVVRRGALIGMNCVVNDNAEVGEDAVVAALAFVKAEAKIPARSLAAGIPAKVLREMSEVADVCPQLSGEQLRRAQAEDAATGKLQPFDKAEGRARLEKLLTEAPPSSTAGV
jgi:phenylacetic acid degradation protein